MALTALQIKNLEIQDKDYWLSDEKGLRLLVKRNGAKYWRLKYRFQGKQKTLALGVYPDVSLKDARLARDESRLKIAKGIDPSNERKEEKRNQLIANGFVFSVLAKEWWENQKGTWTEDHANRVWTRLKDNSFNSLDSIPLESIKPQDVLAVIRAIEKRGALDVASRVLQDIRRVFSFAIQSGKLTFNPATDLSGVLKARKSQRRASLPNNRLGPFLVDLRSYSVNGRLLTQLALELLVYTFVRPGELRGCRWEEFSIEERIWRIPASRMKMNQEHLVPLSDQAIEILEKIKPITGRYDLVFPSEKRRENPMSDNTMRMAMFRMGYDGETEGKPKATPHGFRANASSILNESGFNPDAVERQLAHIERNNVRAAYIYHAQYLDERTKIMQWWADYIDEQYKKAVN